MVKSAQALPVRAAVSVPFRGFRGLQGRGFNQLDAAFHVSVPFRGFRGLQGLPKGRAANTVVVTFQSPSGVLGVCRDEEAAYNSTFKGVFQSPSGVLGVCRD